MQFAVHQFAFSVDGYGAEFTRLAKAAPPDQIKPVRVRAPAAQDRACVIDGHDPGAANDHAANVTELPPDAANWNDIE